MSSLTTKAKSYSFWSAEQLKSELPQQVLAKSLIVNPYKSGRLIAEALEKGVSQMVVSDIDELSKISEVFFQLRKTKKNLRTSPKFLWMVEDAQEGLEDLKLLKECQIQIEGLYFDQNFTLCSSHQFQKQAEELGYQGQNYKAASMQEFMSSHKTFSELKIIPEIWDYSELENYMIACRVIGTDPSGQHVFSDECLQYVCPLGACSCGAFNAPQEVVEVAGTKWALMKPNRLGELNPDKVVTLSKESL